MNFNFGYNENVDNIPEIYDKYKSDEKNKLSEIFFSFPGLFSGRSELELSDRNMYVDYNFLKIKLISTLQRIKNDDLKFNFLINSTCNGELESTIEQEKKIDGVLEYLSNAGCLPKIVTTNSPFVAKYMKKRYNLETRLSVLSGVHTLEQIKYICEVFDSFYVGFDKARDISFMFKVKEWCKRNGKKLGMLVNGGCTSNCPYVMYHSNITSHFCDTVSKGYQLEQEFAVDSLFPCRMMLQNKDRRISKVMFLQATWVRPEDIFRYEDCCDFAKISTRTIAQKYQSAIQAYIQGRYDGNLLDIVEINMPDIKVDNRKFPDDYFTHISSCGHNCSSCQYCNNLADIV